MSQLYDLIVVNSTTGQSLPVPNAGRDMTLSQAQERESVVRYNLNAAYTTKIVPGKQI